MMKHSVIFDMDMVLVTSRPCLYKAMDTYFEGHGVKVDYSEFGSRFKGRNEKHFFEHVCKKNGLPYSDEVKTAIFEIYDKLADEYVKPVEGAAELVTRLKADGYKIALGSSTDRIKVNANMRAAGIDIRIFDAVVCGEDATDSKPSPQIFLLAAGKMGEMPENCIVVEDAINGIQAAHAAGMKVIAFTSAEPADVLKQYSPDFIVERLAEVYNIVNGLL